MCHIKHPCFQGWACWCTSNSPHKNLLFIFTHTSIYCVNRLEKLAYAIIMQKVVITESLSRVLSGSKYWYLCQINWILFSTTYEITHISPFVPNAPILYKNFKKTSHKLPKHFPLRIHLCIKNATFYVKKNRM